MAGTFCTSSDPHSSPLGERRDAPFQSAGLTGEIELQADFE
jgi:hypothetical protein